MCVVIPHREFESLTLRHFYHDCLAAFWEGNMAASFLCRATVFWLRSIRPCESRQVRKKAAVSNKPDVSRVRLRTVARHGKDQRFITPSPELLAVGLSFKAAVYLVGSDKMSTLDRFKDVLAEGYLPDELGGSKLTAQAKYDFLAAVHTMDQIEAVNEAIANRQKKRDKMRRTLISSCATAIKKMIDNDKLNDLAGIEAAIKALNGCRDELIKLSGEEQSENVLKKFVADGITAKEM